MAKLNKFNLQLSADPIYTNGQLKVNTLIEIGSKLHFDDDPEEIMACEEAGHDDDHDDDDHDDEDDD